MGRRRHRGRSRDARPAPVHAAAPGGRVQADQQAEGRPYRDRPRADRHPNAAQAWGGEQIRRILRSGPRQSFAGRPRHHRQYGAGIWRDLRVLPGRFRDDQLSRRLEPGRRSHRARQGLCVGAGHVPIERHGTAVHRNDRPRPRRRRSVAGRSKAPARPGDPGKCQGELPVVARQGLQGRKADGALRDGGRDLRSRPRRCRDRRHHVLHQHVEPGRDDGRRAFGPQGRGQGPEDEALGQDLLVAGLAGGGRISRGDGPASRSRRARLQPHRLRLHDLHRQFWTAADRDLQSHQRQRHRGGGRHLG